MMKTNDWFKTCFQCGEKGHIARNCLRGSKFDDKIADTDRKIEQRKETNASSDENNNKRKCAQDVSSVEEVVQLLDQITFSLREKMEMENKMKQKNDLQKTDENKKLKEQLRELNDENKETQTKLKKETIALSKLKEDFAELQIVHEQNLTRLNALQGKYIDLGESLSKKDEEIANKVSEEERKAEEQAEESKKREQDLKKSHEEELKKMQAQQIEKDQSFKKEIEFFTKRISKLTRERDRLRDSSGRLFAAVESRRLEREEEELKNTELLLRLTKLEDKIKNFLHPKSLEMFWDK